MNEDGELSYLSRSSHSAIILELARHPRFRASIGAALREPIDQFEEHTLMLIDSAIDNLEKDTAPHIVSLRAFLINIKKLLIGTDPYTDSGLIVRHAVRALMDEANECLRKYLSKKGGING